ncbi:MAG TPA: serine protease, partial [Bacteroidota bacterium]
FSDNSVRGTATVIANDGRKIALLTCAHVVSFPDTVTAYYFGADKRPTRYLRSVSVKMKQFNFVSPFPENGSVELVVVDAATDIAVVGRQLDSEISRGIPVFRYPLGKAMELGWGSFVYVFSFPAGVKMITKGIVSSPRKDSEGSFYVDAPLSSGSSGGIVLAIRDGIPNFELVGIVRIVPAKFTYYLAPKEKNDEDYNLYDPYTGETYVRKRTDLELGVTKCIPAEAVRELLKRHERELVAQGYDCSAFLNPG